MKAGKLLTVILSAALTAAMMPDTPVSAQVTYYLEDEGIYLILDEDFPHCTTMDEVVTELRKSLEKSETCKLFVTSELYKSIASDYYSVIHKALKETSSPFDGDYLRYKLSDAYLESRKVNNEYAVYIGGTKITTPEQEKEVNKRCSYISTLLKTQKSERQQKGKKFTDYDTVKFIYDYLIKNVNLYNDYDITNEYNTAYGALVKGEATGKGIAHAFYRLVREAGINCRIIAGKTASGLSEMSSAWNIVQLDGKYYYVDIASDKLFGGNVPFFFLCGEKEFQTMCIDYAHIRNRRNEHIDIECDYTADAFYAEYPVADNRYSAAAFEYGDVNSDGKVDAVDASAVLRYYAETSAGRTGSITDSHKVAADVTRNGHIDAVDASNILSYYAVSSTKNVGTITEYLSSRK